MNRYLTRFQFSFFLFVMAIPAPLRAQVIQTQGKNNSVNYERLAKIDDLVNGYIKNNWVTGVVTIVVKDNQLIQYKGYGYSSAEAKSPCQMMPSFE